MFADSLLDSQWANRSHRGWTTLASFGLQAAGVGLILVLPLLYTQGIFLGQPSPRVVAQLRHLEAAPEVRSIQHSAGNSVQSELRGPALQTPPEIPLHVYNQADAAPPSVPFSIGNPTGSNCGRACVGVLDSTGDSAVVIPPPPVVGPAPKPRTSVMMEGSLMHRVEPIYPVPAKAMGIQGTVVLAAVVSREGTIEKLKVVSGHPFLAQAAVEAVRQWRYRPYVLNGEPVEVDTQITVNFLLSR